MALGSTRLRHVALPSRDGVAKIGSHYPAKTAGSSGCAAHPSRWKPLTSFWHFLITPQRLLYERRSVSTHVTAVSPRAINSPIISGCAPGDFVVCLSVMSLRHDSQTHRSSSFGCWRLLSSCGLGTCWCSPNLSQSLPGHALPFGVPKSCSPSTSLLTFLQALCLSLFPECQTNHFITAVSRFRSEPSDVAKLNSFPDLTLTTRLRKRLQLLQSPPQNPQQLSIHYNVRGADRGKPWTSCFIFLWVMRGGEEVTLHRGPYQ